MSKLTAGQVVEIPGFILLSEYGVVMHANAEMPNYGYTTVMPHTVTFTVPDDFNPVAAEVAAIEKKLDAMADAYHRQVANLNQRKAELLCIENAPTVTE